MKKLLKIGNTLKGSEQKLIKGGNILNSLGNGCSNNYGCANDCSEGDICEIHTLFGCIFGEIKNGLCCA